MSKQYLILLLIVFGCTKAPIPNELASVRDRYPFIGSCNRDDEAICYETYGDVPFGLVLLACAPYPVDFDYCSWAHEAKVEIQDTNDAVVVKFLYPRVDSDADQK